MIDNRRLLAVGGALALAAVALAGTHVLGGPGLGRAGKERLASTGSQKPEGAVDRRFSEELASPFAGRPLVSYRTQAGETLFAFQLQPGLQPSGPRPRDLLILIDTSASQAGPILRGAIKTAEQLVSKLSPE